MRKFDGMWRVVGLAALVPMLSLAAIPAQAQPGAPALDIPFRNIGPAISGGRVTAVAGLPGNYNVYYLGTMLNQIVAARRSIAGVRQARSVDAQLRNIEEQVFNPAIQHEVGEDMLHALFRTHGKLTRLAQVASFGYYVPPDASMLAAHQVVRQELDAALVKYHHLVSTEIPRLNQALQSSGKQPVRDMSVIKIDTGARS